MDNTEFIKVTCFELFTTKKLIIGTGNLSRFKWGPTGYKRSKSRTCTVLLQVAVKGMLCCELASNRLRMGESWAYASVEFEEQLEFEWMMCLTLIHPSFRRWWIHEAFICYSFVVFWGDPKP